MASGDTRDQLTEYEIRLGLVAPQYTFLAEYNLTPTEEMVARLVIYGRTARQIDAILHIEDSTARHHVERVTEDTAAGLRRRCIDICAWGCTGTYSSAPASQATDVRIGRARWSGCIGVPRRSAEKSARAALSIGPP